MRLSAAAQAVRALEEEGARWVFGIPGTHTLELFDALAASESVEPVLTADERGAAFMADAVSRVSPVVGVVAVVPGAGVTHALSGVAEAFLDQVPLVVLACGVRRDGPAFQLHDIDQAAVLAPVTKAVLKVARSEEVYAAVRSAFALARAVPAGPVAVEVPAEVYLLGGAVEPAPFVPPRSGLPPPDPRAVAAAAELLNAARRPILYAGQGARGAAGLLRETAEALGAPVATTLHGKGVLPEGHPLFLWNGLGRSAPPFVRSVEGAADAMLAVGCRFAEVATGSYGFEPPAGLVHVDADPKALGRNFPAKVQARADAGEFLAALLPLLRRRSPDRELAATIARGHAEARRESLADPRPDRVTPAALFEALQEAAGPEAVFVVDSGQGMFQAMEALRLPAPGRFLGPFDFSCMGYGVPAAIGAKLARPEAPVVAAVGDGALLMTGMELLTAASRGVAPVVVVLRDGQLGQIARFQERALSRRTCADLPAFEVSDLARAWRCAYLKADADGQAADRAREALSQARGGKPVLLEAAIDGERPTWFTRGVVATNFRRLPAADKVRMAARAVVRRLF